MLLAKVAAAILIAGPHASDYRDRYPMPDGTVPNGWGVNVNSRDLTEKDLDGIAQLGAKWIRLDLLWSNVERKAGEYNFSKYDDFLADVQKRGMRAILVLNYGNGVYGVATPNTREGRTAFANYAAVAVKHYRHQGVLWEIWNEPNLNRYWRGKPSAEEYAALVKVVVPAMREVSSDEWIIGPATSRFDWPYLEEAFANGVLPLIDAISVHPYRDQAPPETVMADWDRLRRLVAQYAPPGKNLPLICSEWGYSSYAKGVPAVKQGHYAVRAYLSNLAAGAPLTIWYAWKERPDIESEKEKHFGLVTSDLNPKPGFLTVQSTLASLKGFTLDGKLDLGDSRDLGFVFKKGAEERLAVWTIDNLPKKVMFSRATASLPVHLGGAVTERLVEVTDAVQVLKGL